jgi:hypothetical protein
MNKQDEQYLHIIAIFHYVVAGIAALFACFPIFHLTIGIGMMTGSFLGAEIPPEDAWIFPIFGLFFTIIPGMIIVAGWAYAICMALAGYFLHQRQRYMFCIVMAAISCTFMPFGTVLGVFTIIVLVRPSVKEAFEANAGK